MKKEEIRGKVAQIRDQLADVGRAVDTLPDLEEFESLTRQLASAETDVNEVQKEFDEFKEEIEEEKEAEYARFLLDGGSPMAWMLRENR